MSDPTRPIDPDSPPGRREFLARVARLSALAAAGGLAQRALAQTAAPPVDPPGTVPNPQVARRRRCRASHVHSERPLTASVPAEHHHYAVTPNDRMFIRNNLLTPDLDAAKHRLTIRGWSTRTWLSLEELKKAFPVVTTQAMVECAGSGRTAFLPRPSGTPWSPTGGMGCPRWTGVRLADVLRRRREAERGSCRGPRRRFRCRATPRPSSARSRSRRQWKDTP